MRSAWVLVGVLLLLPSRRISAQTEPVLLSSACFDSLPYGVKHTCQAFVRWRAGDSLDSLRVRLEAATRADSALPSNSKQRKKDLLVTTAPRRPVGCCRHPFAAVDSLNPEAAVSLVARTTGKETEAILEVVASALTYEGATRSPLGLTLCYIAHYSVALGLPAPPESQH
jgi:hypothetical protein